MLTRREFWHVAGLALSAGRLAAAAESRTDSCPDHSNFHIQDPTTRAYRADALVTLLGVPVFSRKDVGSAFAALCECTDGEHKTVKLHFAGGSHPERTHGLSYQGALEEVVLEQGTVRPRATYFGFVSAGKDENYEQARQRILSKATTGSRYIAVEGLHIAGCARCEHGSVAEPEDQPRSPSELMQSIREEFPNTDRIAKELATHGDSAAATFLYTVRSAIRSKRSRSCLDYVHNAEEFRLEWEQTKDPHAGQAMTANGMTARPDAIIRFSGRIVHLSTRQASIFRLWLDDQSDLPLRIEFQPRSYLWINLEYEPAGSRPNNYATEEI